MIRVICSIAPLDAEYSRAVGGTNEAWFNDDEKKIMREPMHDKFNKAERARDLSSYLLLE